MGTWTQRGGTKIAIADMSNGHLLNTHKMVVYLLRPMLEVPDDGRLFFRVRESYEGRAWNCKRWIEVLAKECYERSIETLVDAPPDANLIHEPTLIFDAEGYDYRHVSEMEDAEVLEWYNDLSGVGGILLDCATHTAPSSDAACDAWEQEYRFALEMETKAADWLPLFRGEVGRRGLEASNANPE